MSDLVPDVSPVIRRYRYYAICPHCLEKVYVSAIVSSQTHLSCDYCYLNIPLRRLKLHRERDPFHSGC